MSDDSLDLKLCWERDLHLGRDAAERLIRAAAGDVRIVERLRRFLARDLAPAAAAALRDRDVVRLVAERIARGEIVAFRSRVRGGAWTARHVPAEQPEPVLATQTTTELTWIQIRLVDMEGEPVPNERYILRMPDGSERTGRLDYVGRARVERIDTPGTCMVSFPDLDGAAWEPIG